MNRFVFILVAAATLSAAKDGGVDPVNKNWRGLAVKGYDVVAYFTDSRPVEGSAKFSHTWNGATWRFATAEHRDAFVKDPARYAPQFGGYCAWAVSKNYTADVDPEAWKIIDGKLYLNYSKAVQKMWEKDVLSRIEVGNQNWPGLHK